jgi:hypothetical protein
VFDDHHTIASVDKCVQHVQQFVDVGHVQTCCRFIQNIQCFAGGAAAELGRQFDSLGFAAGQSRRRLAKAEKAQTNINPRL